jgi:dsDNA-specific endonuclease/ATPase MutS2
MARTDLLQARAEFATEIDGIPTVVHKGELVREGHPLLKGRRALFEPYEPKVRFEVKQPAKG